MRNVLIFLFVLAILLGTALFFIKKSTGNNGNISQTTQNILSPFADKLANTVNNATTQIQPTIQKPNTIFADLKRFNVLLIGTDTGTERKAEGQLSSNTDVMIMLAVDTTTNKVLLTSVPRDLWINDNKLNALYAVNGYDNLKNAYEKITGQKIDGYIIADFDAFRWIVDSFGGVPVQIQTTFTDTTFPKMDDSGVQTVTFTKGYELMNGLRALTFARSRHGDNGEGSDLMRAKRQHLILEGLVKAVSQPKSTFWPMNMDTFYSQVVEKTKTSLTLTDAYYLWDFYKDRDKYTIESFVVGDKYLYFPGLYPDSPYRAWVFIPRDNTWTQLHKDIEAKLNGTFVDDTQNTNNVTTLPTPAQNA